MNAPGCKVAAGKPVAKAIDEDHLGRMTLGDRGLERQVLGLFVHQAALLLGRIRCRQPGPTAMAAHTLKGSARGVGAWRVARAAADLERAVGQGAAGPALEAAVEELEAAVAEANAAIGARA